MFVSAENLEAEAKALGGVPCCGLGLSRWFYELTKNIVSGNLTKIVYCQNLKNWLRLLTCGRPCRLN